MKKIKSIGVILLSVCILAGLFPRVAYAASARVSVSTASGNVGSEVSIKCTATMSGSDIGSADITLHYDDKALLVVDYSDGSYAASGGAT